MTDYIELLGLKSSDLLSREHVLDDLKKAQNGYYVYAIWRVINGAPIPFYIGKGKGRRLTIHLCPSTASQNRRKGHILAKLTRSGEVPLLSIIQHSLTEQDAHEFEKYLILKVGRLDLGSGPLCNLTDGGEGMSGNIGLKWGKHPRARPVIAENIHFSCQAEADKSLGLTSGRTLYRISHGWPGYRFRDGEQMPCRKGRRIGQNNSNSRPCVIEGISFDMISDACNHFNMPMSTLYQRIKLGWDNYYFIDEGQRKRALKAYSTEHMAKLRLNRDPVKRYIKVIIYNICYPSYAEAARQIGVCPATIRNRCRNSAYPDYKVQV